MDQQTRSKMDSGLVIPTTLLVSFLERLQETALRTFGSENFDPKLYVDLSLKTDLSTAQDVFNSLERDQNGLISGRYYESKHNLSRYYTKWNSPRPESSTIDQETASKVSNESDKKLLYRELASTAESGWDFSTRWMRDSSDLSTVSTTSILPVDLNAYILKMELDISFFSQVTGDDTTANRYSEAAQARKEAMTSIFWNEELGQWLDYWLENGNTDKDENKWKASNQNRNAFASNFIPLWIELFHSDEALVDKVMTGLKKSGLLCAVGIATSLTNSGLQWDFPNGWAPLQHLIIEGLVKSGSKEARFMAQEISVNWIRTNHLAYVKSGAMHEKYNVEKCGEFGSGGEYIPEAGFGWSNGVVLAFLEEFGWDQDLKINS